MWKIEFLVLNKENDHYNRFLQDLNRADFSKEREGENSISISNTHQLRRDQLISLQKVSDRFFFFFFRQVFSPFRLTESRQFSQQTSQCCLTTNKYKRNKINKGFRMICYLVFVLKQWARNLKIYLYNLYDTQNSSLRSKV